MNLNWRRLERKFEDYEIWHSGGGIFLMYKNSPSLNGTSAMVSISDEFVLSFMDDTGKQASTEDVWKDEESFEYYYNDGNHQILIMEYTEGKTRIDEAAKNIFSNEVIKQIKKDFELFSDVCWGKNADKPKRMVLEEPKLKEAFVSQGFSDIELFIHQDYVTDEESNSSIKRLVPRAKIDGKEIESKEIYSIIKDYFVKNGELDVEIDLDITHNVINDKVEATGFRAWIDIYTVAQ